MERAAEWTLHDLRRQTNETHAAEAAALAALGRDDALFATAAPILSRQLGVMAARADALEKSSERQAALVREQKGRARRAEQAERAARVALGQKEERARLENLAEMVARRPRSIIP